MSPSYQTDNTDTVPHVNSSKVEDSPSLMASLWKNKIYVASMIGAAVLLTTYYAGIEGNVVSTPSRPLVPPPDTTMLNQDIFTSSNKEGCPDADHTDKFHFYNCPDSNICNQRHDDKQFDLKKYTTHIAHDISNGKCLAQIKYSNKEITIYAEHHKTKSVSTSFKSMNNIVGQNVKSCGGGDRKGSFPDELNYWVSMNLHLEGYGTIHNFVLAQGSNDYLFGAGNNYWIGGPTCYFVEGHYSKFCCKMTNGVTVQLNYCETVFDSVWIVGGCT